MIADGRAALAHDLSNLLAAMLAASGSVLARSGTDPATQADARAMAVAAERAAVLVQRLRDSEREEPRPVAVNGAIRALSGVLERASGPGVRLELVLRARPDTVRIDRAALDRALLNLAVNAGQAMAGGGTLTIETGSMPGGKLSVEFRDTGGGIAPDMLPRLFEPGVTTRRDGGGLGLATVRDIARAAGGSVAAENRRGEGACFRVGLPLCADSVASAAEPPEDTRMSSHPAGRPLLFVEDEAGLRNCLTAALRDFGWDVVAKAAGSDALKWAVAAPVSPAIAVIDLSLPDIEGSLLVRALRLRWPDLPALVMSGYADAQVRERLDGVDAAILTKPCSLDRLLAAVSAMTALAKSKECEHT